MPRLKSSAVYVIEDLYDTSSVEPLQQHFNCVTWRRSQTKYRDDKLLIVSIIMPNKAWALDTEHPVAIDSYDHIEPKLLRVRPVI